MKTYKWTCSGCETPNILVVDTNKPGQTSLNCHQCGIPGVFEKETETVVLRNATVLATFVDAQVDSTVHVEYNTPFRLPNTKGLGYDDYDW